MTDSNFSHANHGARPEDSCKRFYDLIPLYSTDALELRDRFDLESHADACEHCREELNEFNVLNAAILDYLSEAVSGAKFFTFGDIQRRAFALSGVESPTDEIIQHKKLVQVPRTSATYTNQSHSTEQNKLIVGNLRDYRLDPDSLTVPDHPKWQHDSNYSDQIATKLAGAYALLHDRKMSQVGFSSAYAQVNPLLQLRMSLEQRLRMHYLMAISYAGQDDFGSALDHVGTALELAKQTRAKTGYAQLTFLRGTIYEQLQRFRLALSDFTETKRTLGHLQDDGCPLPDEGALVNAELKIASQLFMLAQYERSQGSLEEARILLGNYPTADEEIGAFLWLESLVNRWTNQSAKAVNHASQAVEIYSHIARPAPLALIETIAANALLDSIENLNLEEDQSMRERHLVQSAAYLTTSLFHALQSSNQAVIGITQLLQARYERLSFANTNRVGRYESVIRMAKHIDDAALLGQAYTALGDELLQSGSSHVASNLFSTALDVLGANEISTWAIWPQRRLLRLSELGTRA